MRVQCHNDRGKIHRDCAHAHGQINSPSGKDPSSRRNGNHVIDRCSHQMLYHFLGMQPAKVRIGVRQ